jgi:hypothetical protein
MPGVFAEAHKLGKEKTSTSMWARASCLTPWRTRALVQALIAKAPVETLNVGILHQSSGLNRVPMQALVRKPIDQRRGRIDRICESPSLQRTRGPLKLDRGGLETSDRNKGEILTARRPSARCWFSGNRQRFTAARKRADLAAGPAKTPNRSCTSMPSRSTAPSRMQVSDGIFEVCLSTDQPHNQPLPLSCRDKVAKRYISQSNARLLETVRSDTSTGAGSRGDSGVE